MNKPLVIAFALIGFLTFYPFFNKGEPLILISAHALEDAPKTTQQEQQSTKAEPTQIQAKPQSGLSIVRPPSIKVETIRFVLQQYGSPAVNEAQTIYDLGMRYGIDPAFCLAFFVMESSAGTKGMARETRSIGNIRATPGYVNYKGYRKYSTWREGIEDWYRLITRLYVGVWGLNTIEQIVPVYAPSSDGNNPYHYMTTVRNLVNEWGSR